MNVYESDGLLSRPAATVRKQQRKSDKTEIKRKHCPVQGKFTLRLTDAMHIEKTHGNRKLYSDIKLSGGIFKGLTEQFYNKTYKHKCIKNSTEVI